ncbi:TIGR03936 family radical SAM-associated protein [Nocardioides sp. AX2bis]|uniref:TIGR03936 family radical SAM-associated protein n=1 Tax=Nocardioides sp. AX2bis TaxID=2653157 RepID=UPI0012F4571D|nr:TIGR03936 family radical SAM-associated protein [Nocardioides sp. AX2bis]VXB85260.1 Radical SAM-linked protein [Nocardioides sp. AX2bis]
MSRAQPEQQAPPVQRLRVRYAKRGRMRFTSHRDFSRAFERALVRARVPMAYSSGFNPHPRISYAGASPTGSASEAEYLEIGLAQVLDPADVARTLAGSLPPGLDVVEVADVATARTGGLTELLQASRWRVETDLPVTTARAGVTDFLALESVPVERMTKKGLRTFDCRTAVLHLEVEDAEVDAAGRPGSTLDLLLRHTVPSVRPDDVLTGIRSCSSLPLPDRVLLTRLAQGPLTPAEDGLEDPLSAAPAPG